MLPVIFNNNLFKDLFNENFSKEFEKAFGTQESKMMKTDIKETEKEFNIRMDLPGFLKEEINAELKDGYLTVKANKNTENTQEDKEGKFILKERYCGGYSRSFYVGEEVSDEDINAKYENGTLTIAIPKKEPQEEPKKIIDIK